MKTQRLESLDVLRGLDLFCLTMLAPFIHSFHNTGDYTWLDPVMSQFTHVNWEGFSAWDLVMPLFMFMAGVSMPFSFSKYTNTGKRHKTVYYRIIKRVVLLWLLGMVCQGNLLSLDIDKIKIFTNTLQAIAAGYLFASIIILNAKIKWQIIITSLLLVVYWAIMSFVTIDGFGNGSYEIHRNVGEYIERVVLGRFRDGASINEYGEVVYPIWYGYTWILSSITFTATVMTGVLAGEILKLDKTHLYKVKTLALTGILMAAMGWLLQVEIPVIKKLWTSSMVLVSSGYCFMLMSLFYYIVDYKKKTRYLMWLKVFGMNSILAYVISAEVGVISFSSVSRSLFYGLQQYVGDNWFQFIITLSNLAIVYIILYVCYKNKCFLKV